VGCGRVSPIGTLGRERKSRGLPQQRASIAHDRHHIQSKEDRLYFIGKYSLERIRDDFAAAVAKVEDPLGRVRAMIGAQIETHAAR
jgi:hypothetical protein